MHTPDYFAGEHQRNECTYPECNCIKVCDSFVALVKPPVSIVLKDCANFPSCKCTTHCKSLLQDTFDKCTNYPRCGCKNNCACYDEKTNTISELPTRCTDDKGQEYLTNEVPTMLEIDPNGLNQHEAGAKLDDGKIRAGMVMKGFAHALMEVSKVGTIGSIKYTPFGFLEVSNGEERYEDAQMRHFLKGVIEGPSDPELNELAKKYNIEPDKDVLHLACEAWNALAKLEMHLRNNK